MDAVFPSPVATAFEALTALTSAALYLIVGAAAFVSAPRDIRARVFFAVALASAAPYSVTALLWARGSRATFTVPVIALVGLSLMMGSLALFHFTQVFPWRRPWIRAQAKWLLAGYVTVPIAVAGVAWMLRGVDVSLWESDGLGAVSADTAEGLALVLLLVVVPIVGVTLLQATATVIVGATGYLLLAVAVLLISLLGLRIGVALFDREAILTRWR